MHPLWARTMAKNKRENTKIMVKIVYVFHPRFSRSAPVSSIFTLLVSNWCETHSIQLAKTDFKTIWHSKFCWFLPTFSLSDSPSIFSLLGIRSLFHLISHFFLSLWYTFSHSTVNAFIECEEFQSNLHHTRSHYRILADNWREVILRVSRISSLATFSLPLSVGFLSTHPQYLSLFDSKTLWLVLVYFSQVLFVESS